MTLLFVVHVIPPTVEKSFKPRRWPSSWLIVRRRRSGVREAQSGGSVTVEDVVIAPALSTEPGSVCAHPLDTVPEVTVTQSPPLPHGEVVRWTVIPTLVRALLQAIAASSVGW